MSGIKGTEGEVLRRYLRGREVRPQDKEMVEEFISTGLMQAGFSLKKRQKTARTTVLGCRAI